MEKKTESSNSNVTNAPITLSSPLGQPNENFTAGRNAPLSVCSTENTLYTKRGANVAASSSAACSTASRAASSAALAPKYRSTSEIGMVMTVSNLR